MGIGAHGASRVATHVEGFPTHGKDHAHGAGNATRLHGCPVHGKGYVTPGGEAAIVGVDHLKYLFPRPEGRSLQGGELVSEPVVDEARAMLLVDVEGPTRHVAPWQANTPAGASGVSISAVMQ